MNVIEANSEPWVTHLVTNCNINTYTIYIEHYLFTQIYTGRTIHYNHEQLTYPNYYY